MPELLYSPVLLGKSHITAGFDCGKKPLNDFLIKFALQNQASGGARTYVMLRSDRVVAPEDTPERVIKGQGRTFSSCSRTYGNP